MANLAVYSRMQDGDPLAIYKKLVLGRVEVKVLDPFDEVGKTVENVTLKGKPTKNNSDCFVELWSIRDLAFFESMNSSLIEQGYIGKLKVKKKPKPTTEKESYANYSDEDLEELVTAKFMALKHKLNEIESEAILYRVLRVAEECERPEATLKHIRQRITEIQ